MVFRHSFCFNSITCHVLIHIYAALYGSSCNNHYSSLIGRVFALYMKSCRSKPLQRSDQDLPSTQLLDIEVTGSLTSPFNQSRYLSYMFKSGHMSRIIAR